MTVNVMKCLSVSPTWKPNKLSELLTVPFRMRKKRWTETEHIQLDSASVYLGLPISFKRECSLDGKCLIQSMKERILRLGECNLDIAQKMEGTKSMELPKDGGDPVLHPQRRAWRESRYEGASTWNAPEP
jgi:hypothetical protein